ncbi:MAG: twin-arginine translocation signal domain-containing protein, partial [Pirellulaceae bacterium]
MSKTRTRLHRRRFLKNALSAAGAAVAAPTIIPSSALGLDGAVAPSERIVVGGIGIGRRGGYDLG